MNLIDYEGKRVRIKTVNNNIFEGMVGDYCYPEDDENNLEMIVVDVDVDKGKSKVDLIGFYEKDIETIDIIE